MVKTCWNWSLPVLLLLASRGMWNICAERAAESGRYFGSM